MDAAERNNFSVALAASLSGHVLLAIILLIGFGSGTNFSSGIVYSVTLEGGKQIGGISQLQQSDKTSVAPPKNVSSKPEETKPVAKEDTQEKTSDAEVSLAEKKKEEQEKKREDEQKKKLEEKKLADKKKKEDEEKKKAEKKKAPPPADVSKDYQKALQRYLGESTDAGGKGFGAAKIGGKGMGGGELIPAAVLSYVQIVKNRIQSGWSWPYKSDDLKTYVNFSIAPDGTISGARIEKGSGNSEYDGSLMRAIYKASPLPPPPAEFYEKYLKFITGDFTHE